MKTIFMLLVIGLMLTGATAVITKPKEAEHAACIEQIISDAAVSAVFPKANAHPEARGVLTEAADEISRMWTALLNKTYQDKFFYTEMTAQFNGLQIQTRGYFGRVVVVEKTIPRNWMAPDKAP